VLEINSIARFAVASVRAGEGPRALVLHTYRYAPHSKGDDTRDPQEVIRYRKRDPLPFHAKRLTSDFRRQIDSEVEAEVNEAFRQAQADPLADPATLTPPVDIS
ncbi:MAG: hypothetical protein KAT23_08395, partial [Anaerolineales bacterium]|nr:hypothetical protein [Anaerolineales bacterium]